MSNYLIIIPTRNRFFMMEKRTGVWKYFDPKTPPPHNLMVIVREEEIEECKRNTSIPALSVDNSCTIAGKKETVRKNIEKGMYGDIEHLFILDDDIDFYYREEELSSKYTNRYEEVMKRKVPDQIIDQARKICGPEFPMYGLPLKQGSQGRKYWFEKNVPIIRFACIHVPTLLKEGIHLDGLGTAFMGDRYTQLSFLKKGYPTITDCRFAIGDIGTGYKGGCSVVRGVAEQEEAARALIKAFPEAVTGKMKENGLWSERRLDCSIKWKYYLKPGELPYVPMEEMTKRYGI